MLKSSGFSQVKWIGQLEGQTFCKDPHCGDVLVFPGRLRPRLYSTKLLSDHRLVIQVRAAQREEVSHEATLLPVDLNTAVGMCLAPSICTGCLCVHFGNVLAQIAYKTLVLYAN